MEIAIDFDGTCVTHEFPNVGADIGAVPVLKKIVNAGHSLILFTMRSDNRKTLRTDIEKTTSGGNYLTDAVNWFKSNDIPLHGVQVNPSQNEWTTSPKCYAQLYIDDAALGCPLSWEPNISDRAFVDWKAVEKMLIERMYI